MEPRTSRSRRRSPTCSSSSRVPARGGHLGTRREEEQAKLREHYSRMFYRAVLNATKRSARAIKKRVGSRASGRLPLRRAPLLRRQRRAAIPHVSMTPTLDDIQAAINRCCRAILAIAKALVVGRRPRPRAGATIFDDIARDKEIVKMVLLLTGSIEGAKRQVFDYLETFLQYDWLWQGQQGRRVRGLHARRSRRSRTSRPS